jgi:SAM-dependent methyltransferase
VTDSRLGVVAPDGSPVDVYRALPRPEDADLVHAAIPAGASILDLGAGVGRFAVVLAALGHPVVAVDHEPAMLAGLGDVDGIAPVVADIAGLALSRRFDAVLLASHLVDDDELGPVALAVARDHLAPGGRVIAETYPPGVDWVGRVGQRSMVGPVGITVTRARVDGDHLTATVRYDLDGRTWDQPFTTRLLDDATLATRLAEAGFVLDRWLVRDRGWLVARPV